MMVSKSLLRALPGHRELILYACGGSAIAASLGLKALGGDADALAIADLIKELGIVTTTSTLVSAFLNDDFVKAMQQAFAIVRETKAAGITHIYADRPAALTRIEQLLRVADGQIEMMGIAGTDFCQGMLYERIADLYDRDRNIHVRMLLQDPLTVDALTRSIREDSLTHPDKSAYLQSNLKHHILQGIGQLCRLRAEGSKQGRFAFDLQFGLYTSPASLMLVRVDHSVFVEPYHLGLPVSEATHVFYHCLGKRVPVIEYDVDSHAGQLWLQHFEYVWRAPSTFRVPPECTDFDKDLDDYMVGEDDWFKDASTRLVHRFESSQWWRRPRAPAAAILSSRRKPIRQTSP